jgi:elongation factor Ts
MTNISAQQVKALREKTGVSMGDCKKALVEAAGDETKAVEILNKKYAGQLGKRADKEAANGKSGALVELRCETDFVASNEDFKAAADALAKLAADSGETDVQKLMERAGADGRSGKDIIASTYGKFQENISLARAAIIKGGVSSYVHHNGLRGTVLAANQAGGEVGKQICMHITAMNPAGLNREAIDATEVAQAREIMASQVKDKPAQMVDKIVSGKMNRWFAERVLLEQPFALDDKKTVQQAATEAGVAITGYLKFELGGKTTQ